jgi:hypothetical protein
MTGVYLRVVTINLLNTTRDQFESVPSIHRSNQRKTIPVDDWISQRSTFPSVPPVPPEDAAAAKASSNLRKERIDLV